MHIIISNTVLHNIILPQVCVLARDGQLPAAQAPDQPQKRGTHIVSCNSCTVTFLFPSDVTPQYARIFIVLGF